MKLWHVEITYSGYVVASTELDATDTGESELTSEEPDFVHATEVTSTSQHVTDTDSLPYLAVDEDDYSQFIQDHFPEDDCNLHPDNVTVTVWLRYLKHNADKLAAKEDAAARQVTLPEIE